ncbi:hypothetical protein PM082_001247 [Marasmius tenuissimus]|nr:hypothetical protein PM082_001247 [Marasmius tenuissimus]
MRLLVTLSTFATVIALASAQNIPTCALNCLTSADLGGCSQTDTACLCKSETVISNNSACVAKNCEPSDITAALTIFTQLCAQAGISVSIPASLSTAISPSSSSTGTAPSQTSTPRSGNGATGSAGLDLVAGLVGAGLVALAL